MATPVKTFELKTSFYEQDDEENHVYKKFDINGKKFVIINNNIHEKDLILRFKNHHVIILSNIKGTLGLTIQAISIIAINALLISEKTIVLDASCYFLNTNIFSPFQPYTCGNTFHSINTTNEASLNWIKRNLLTGIECKDKEPIFDALTVAYDMIRDPSNKIEDNDIDVAEVFDFFKIPPATG